MTEYKLSLLEKIACIGIGPITGMLPPRIQEKLGYCTKNSYEAASLMSTTSRVVNSGLSSVAGITLIAKAFGVDINPENVDLAVYVGLPLMANTILREGSCALSYVFNGGEEFMDYFGPWGEPISSMVDAKIHPEEYFSLDENVQ